MGTETQGARGNTRHRETKSDITPPSGRPSRHTPSNGEGVGAQEASRAVPVPGAMANQGTLWAMADLGTQEAMRGSIRLAYRRSWLLGALGQCRL